MSNYFTSDKSSLTSSPGGGPPFPSYGLFDKADVGVGLEWDKSHKRITQRNNLIFVDTRDCIGSTSLKDAQDVYVGRGGNREQAGNITNVTGNGVSPITITTDTFEISSTLANGNKVSISGVAGNEAANGIWEITNLTNNGTGDPNTELVVFSLLGSLGNGNYTGGGLYIRPADQGFPRMRDTSSTIVGNVMTVNLNKKLHVVKSLSLIHAVIPRDIIPMEAYLPDFIDFSVFDSTDSLPDCTVAGTGGVIWDSYIPQERKYLDSRMFGYYSSALDLYRTYNFGSFPLPNQVTPPPYTLWNPPVGNWPNQLKPYAFQTVPTYRSNNFTISGKSGTFYIIVSGYGVYDLADWTETRAGFTTTQKQIRTQLARRLLIILLASKQSYRDEDYITLGINSNVINTPPLPEAQFFGFGDFQRFLPGPGLGLNYQPATIHGGDPTDPSNPGPIAFPNFRGNVWGPYDTPGDRFQKIGLRDVVQDLFLNGDTNNLLGMPIIKPYVPTECLMQDETFGFQFSSLIEINMGNISQTTNPNILNAMRIVPNGFGAISQQAKGDGIAHYQNRFQSAGGIGPQKDGIPPAGNAWVNNPVLTAQAGKSSYANPVGAAPQSGLSSAGGGTVLIPQVVDAAFPGNAPGGGGDNTKDITHRVSWYDLGANSNQFATQINDYITWTISELPDTNLVMHVDEALRDSRIQSTNSETTDAILSVPIRLNLGTTSGTLQYVENIQAFLASSTEYWMKRFLTPKASLYKLHITFTTYEGLIIPLEKLLQPRRSVLLLQSFEQIFGTNLFENLDPRGVELSFLFDPLNPTLNGRTKRILSLIFRAETYEYESPGLYMGMVKDMLEKHNEHTDIDNDFIVKASNFEQYNFGNN